MFIYFDNRGSVVISDYQHLSKLKTQADFKKMHNPSLLVICNVQPLVPSLQIKVWMIITVSITVIYLLRTCFLA